MADFSDALSERWKSSKAAVTGGDSGVMSSEYELRLSPSRVLLVDDEPLIRALMADELRAVGAIVLEATSAVEAWSLLLSGERIDLLFSDLRMPGDFDGVGLATRVRDCYPWIPIILTSGNPPPLNLSRFGRFLQKPYSIIRAVQVVLEHLPQARP